MLDRRIAMSTTLTGAVDNLRVATALDSVKVVVVVPDDAAPAVAAAATGLVSMCMRVFGEAVTRGDGRLPCNPWGVETLGVATQVLNDFRTSTTPAVKEVVVAFGSSSPRADWYLGGDDWTAFISKRPTIIGPCGLGGLGLHAAAALVFGEILKSVLRPLGMRCVTVEDELIWNLLDGGLTPAPGVSSGLGVLRGPTTAFLGAGSLGSSAVGILSMTPLRAIAHVVDPDRFDPARNAYRYPAIRPDASGSKAGWGSDVLRTAGWEAETYVGTVRDWVASRPTAGFDGIALVSLDRVDGRLDAADLLARTTVSAGVSGLALHAQLSDPRDDLACSYCAYVDLAPPLTQLEVYVDLTGLAPQRVAKLLDGSCLSDVDIQIAVLAKKIDGKDAAGLAGGRLEDLLHRHYAQARVPVGENGLVAGVSAPHVSWLGGILLAAEVIKTAAGLPPLNRRVELDLSGLPLGGWRRPHRDPTERCVCANPIRRDLARRLYAA